MNGKKGVDKSLKQPAATVSTRKRRVGSTTGTRNTHACTQPIISTRARTHTAIDTWSQTPKAWGA